MHRWRLELGNLFLSGDGNADGGGNHDGKRRCSNATLHCFIFWGTNNNGYKWVLNTGTHTNSDHQMAVIKD